jgi:hypothetical protein
MAAEQRLNEGEIAVGVWFSSAVLRGGGGEGDCNSESDSEAHIGGDLVRVLGRFYGTLTV